ncbi:type VI secretion protein VasK, partial [Pseudomonas sp. LMG 31766]|nr:type VI secretion protein VasK [Pseudomonas chaetocerotis]
MNLPEVKSLSVWRSVLLLGLVLAVLVLLAAGVWWFAEPHRLVDRATLQPFAIRAFALWGLLFSVSVAVWSLTQMGISKRVRQHSPNSGKDKVGSLATGQTLSGEVREQLRNGLGLFWRWHVRVLLVVGEADEIEAVAPGLAAAKWREGQGTLLLWGGSLNGDWESEWPESLRQLSWRRPLDGIVWALTPEQADNVELLGGGVRRLQSMARQLRWKAPLYFWQVQCSRWSQDGRSRQSVGCLLPTAVTAPGIESALRQLVIPLRERGLEQMKQTRTNDFLLRLSRDLESNAIGKWRDALAPLLPSFARGVPLRGLLFAAPQKPATESTLKHSWWPSPEWDAIRDDRQMRASTWGWTWLRGLRAGALCL